MIRVRVPASTSNLGSGFDTFGLALQRYLTVEMAPARALKIVATGMNAADIPHDESNAVLRATKRLFEHCGQILPPVQIRIDNDIPLSRGLGSSGAAAVAGLACAAKLLHRRLDTKEFLQLATELEGHPENAASSLLGGITVSCMENGRPVTEKFELDPRLKFVVLIPEITVSTDRAREILPATVSHADAVFNVQRSALLVVALSQKNYGLLRVAMQDRLHQPFRKQLIPGYDVFAERAYENGALGVCISGSGSSVLAVTVERAEELQHVWKKTTSRLNLSANVEVLSVDNTGLSFL